jgi:hypothetical protein
MFPSSKKSASRCFPLFQQINSSVMAEAAGLALSALGVATLFSSALECFQLVRVGNAFDQDTETY